VANGHDENHSNGVNIHYKSEASRSISSDNNRRNCNCIHCGEHGDRSVAATVLMISVIQLKYRTS
jgi:hypothetical protein